MRDTRALWLLRFMALGVSGCAASHAASQATRTQRGEPTSMPPCTGPAVDASRCSETPLEGSVCATIGASCGGHHTSCFGGAGIAQRCSAEDWQCSCVEASDTCQAPHWSCRAVMHPAGPLAPPELPEAQRA